MTCEKCGEPMARGTGDDRYELSTLVGFFSPPGHNHDDNCVLRMYVCPNGHKRKVSKRRTCPACDWKGKEECFCHAGKKLEEWP